MSTELVAATAANPAAVDQRAVLAALNLNPQDPKVQALVLVCKQYGLDMLLKHAVLIQGSMYVTRDGLLHVAHASGCFDGMEVEYIGMDHDNKHHLARCTVYRKDMKRAFSMQGRYPVNGGNMAVKYGPEMAEKVAVCRTLRMAFDVSLCSREETWDNDDTADVPPVEQRQPAPKYYPDTAEGDIDRDGSIREPRTTSTPRQIPAPTPARPAMTPGMVAAIKAYAGAAKQCGYASVFENNDIEGKPSLAAMKMLFEEQTGVNHEEATSGDWLSAASQLPKYLGALQPIPDAEYVEEPAPAPARQAPRTAVTPSLPVADPDFEDPFGEEEKRPTPYASASSDRGAF